MPSLKRYCELRQGCVRSVYDPVSIFQRWFGSRRFGVSRPRCSRATSIQDAFVPIGAKQLVPLTSSAAVTVEKPERQVLHLLGSSGRVWKAVRPALTGAGTREAQNMPKLKDFFWPKYDI